MLQSILDTDLYKLTMQNAILRLYPKATARYRFFNRRPTDKFSDCCIKQLSYYIKNYMPSLRLLADEEDFLRENCPYLSEDYLCFLRSYRFDPSEVSISSKDGQLDLIVDGPWHRTVLWEVPLMAASSELYFEDFDDWDYDGQVEQNQKKISILEAGGCRYNDFSTRRRRSFYAQQLVVSESSTSKMFLGTSNPYLAMTYGVKPIGTVAHEWIMAHSILCDLRRANWYAIDAWNYIYGNNLNIVLTDTYGTNACLKDFDFQKSSFNDGVRQDSGNPFEFIDKIIHHYRRFGIEPLTKTIVFSDSLTVEKAVEIKKYCDKSGINCVFGIGTHFSNDFEGSQKPLNMVIKLTQLNGKAVAKLSDDIGKETAEPSKEGKEALELAKKTFGR